MALYLRGKVWWTKFYVGGQLHRYSTEQTNVKKAERRESMMIAEAESTGESLIKRKAPVLREFIPKFTKYNKSRIDIEDKTRAYYASGVKLIDNSVLSSMPMDSIKPVVLQSVSFGHSNSNENMGRRTLSKIFSYALELGVINQGLKVPKLKEVGRDILIDFSSEEKVLQLGIQPLSDVLIIALDAGMRPGEVIGIRIEHLRLAQHHYQNPFGKSDFARRKCGISARMRPIIARLANGRTEGWLFKGRKKQQHVSLSHIEHQWADVREGLVLPKKMVLYCARHTWATDLAPYVSGVELQRAGGWADARIASHYQHPGTDRILEVINQRNARYMN